MRLNLVANFSGARVEIGKAWKPLVEELFLMTWEITKPITLTQRAE